MSGEPALAQPEGELPQDRGAGLAVCPVLHELEADAIAELERRCRWLHLAPGSFVFHHDEAPEFCYFLTGGTVRVFFRTQQQQEVNYAQLGPGDLFGELAMIDGLERSADVITVTDTVVAACPRDVFMEFLERFPKMALRMLMRMAAIIRASSQRIADFSTRSGVQRVYLELLRVANPDPSGDGTWVIRPAPLHKDIASWAGTTTDVVGRAIGHLMRSGLVERRPGCLQILNHSRLEAMAHTQGTDEERF